MINSELICSSAFKKTIHDDIVYFYEHMELSYLNLKLLGS